MNIKSINTKINSIHSIAEKGYMSLQTTRNSIVVMREEYNYTDCIFIDIQKDKNLVVRKERVFTNKYKFKGIEKLLISKTLIDDYDILFNYIEEIA